MMKRFLAAAACIAFSLSAMTPAMAERLDRVQTGSIKPDDATAAQQAKRSGNKVVPGAVSRAPFSSIIRKYALLNGVDEDLAHAIVRVESNYNPKIRGSAGEIGLMQIKPATARMMGYQGSAKGLFDPDTNIRYGMKYLAMAQMLGGGETCNTVLKYNAGHGAKRMNPVSKRYCGKVTMILAQN